VRVIVPANVALAVSVLDVDARRMTGRHQAWLQVMPGQELRCNGCHAPFSGLSHGRSDSFASVYAGAPGNGINFPNTLASVSPNMGETMAETRTRSECLPNACAVLEPTLDVIYDEYWEDADPPDLDDGFTYSYNVPELITVLPSMPLNKPPCLNAWDPSCRIVINYEMHIDPLWGADRGANTCTNAGCHVPLDTLGMLAEPAASLDLSPGQDEQVMEHYNSYRELLFADDVRQPVGGALVPVQTGVDVDGNPIIQQAAPSMSAAGARASSAFFSRFDAGGTHAGYLSVHELRLISEWLDIGAQYYNNPFDVPQN
jgi:hypothetical protein